MKEIPDFGRYRHQMVLPFFGERGQSILASSRAVIVGCGALGAALANHCVRMGFGFVRLVDDDRVALDNLHRQTLFTEDDVIADRFKVIAARDALAGVNRGVTIEAVPERVTEQSIAAVCADADIIFDGNDNHPTRFVINRFCIQRGIPWIYGGVIATTGYILAVKPRRTACLACLYPDGIDERDSPTTRTDGVLPTIVAMTAAIQITEGLKLVLDDRTSLAGYLIQMDIWQGILQKVPVERLDSSCPACGHFATTL